MILQTLLKPSALLDKRIPVLLTLVGLLLILTAYAKYRTPLVSDAASHLPLPLETTSQRAETELITIEPHGFEPAEIRRPQGRFRLGIDNRSGLEGIQLQVETAGRSRVPILKNRNRRLSWREEVDLPPGNYVIKEANHPEWSCLIIITPSK